MTTPSPSRLDLICDRCGKPSDSTIRVLISHRPAFFYVPGYDIPAVDTKWENWCPSCREKGVLSGSSRDQG
jgi:hypothetical protein